MRLLFCARSIALKPILQALLLADRIYEDKVTGKKIIAGVFNALFYTKSETPEPVADVENPENQAVLVRGGMDAGSPSLYINLTEVRGDGDAPTELGIHYIDMRDSVVLMRASIQVGATSPLDTVEIVVPMPTLPVPHEGVYALELLYANELLGSIRITANEAR
jgi:hypothetical protein